MRVLFIGSVSEGTGPGNANRAFMQNWPKEDVVYVVDGQSKGEKLRHLLRGCFKADVVLTTGRPGKLGFLVRVIARARKKKIVAFAHGYAPYENVVNGQGLSDKAMDDQKAWLDECDCVVANSRMQMEFLGEQQPSLVGKLEYATLGVDAFPWVGELHPASSVLTVAVTGGTRPIKANEVVARAIKLLNEAGVKARLVVYGRRYAPNAELDSLIEAGYGEYAGQLGHEEFLRDLRMCDMLVMNSRHEPFGLSALDAVQAGTSLLMSRNCGVAEVLNLEPGDFVEDCEDPKEAAAKIAALAQAPNAERIYKGLDFDRIGWKRASLRLRNICARMAGVEVIG